MVYENRGYEDDDFVVRSNSKGNAKNTPISTLEFTRHPVNKIEV